MLKNSQNNSNEGKQCQVSAFLGFVRRLLSRKQSFLEHLLCFSQQTWLLFLYCNCNRNNFYVEGNAWLWKLAFTTCTSYQNVLTFQWTFFFLSKEAKHLWAQILLWLSSAAKDLFFPPGQFLNSWNAKLSQQENGLLWNWQLLLKIRTS